jgi:hypothetical protein
MGIDWMVEDELAESIPPAYSKYIAERFLQSNPAQTPRVNLIAAGLAAYFLSVIAASHGL